MWVHIARPPHKWPHVEYSFVLLSAVLASQYALGFLFVCYALFTCIAFIDAQFSLPCFAGCCYHTPMPTDYGTPFRSGKVSASTFGVS